MTTNCFLLLFCSVLFCSVLCCAVLWSSLTGTQPLVWNNCIHCSQRETEGAREKRERKGVSKTGRNEERERETEREKERERENRS